MENDKPNSQVFAVYKHGFLFFIICLVVFNLFHLVEMFRIDYPNSKYGNVIVSLMLLLNHIAFFYTTKGLASKIMKVIAFAFLITGSIYIFAVAFRGP